MSSIPPIPVTPVSPLPYATPVARRAGMMTAVGIISIVVGSISALSSVSGVLTGAMYIMMSRMTFPPPTPPVPVSTTAPATMPTTTYSTTSTSWWSTGSGTRVTSTSVASPAPFSFNIDLRASILTIVESVLSLGVAIVLIVAGSLLLRNSRKAYRLHRIYVLMKLPLIVVAAFATWWTVSGMMSGMNTLTAGAGSPFPGFGNIMAVMQACIPAVFALMYPIALLIIFSTKTAKDYFNQISDGQGEGSESFSA